MAETTQLAGTFVAWNYIFSVRHRELVTAVKCCLDVGLRPEERGMADSKHILLQVAVPEENGETFLKEVLPIFDGELVDDTRVLLTCPLPNKAE